MEEQDQLLQKVLAANDTDAIAEGERGDDPKAAFSMKVRSMQLMVHDRKVRTILKFNFLCDGIWLQDGICVQNIGLQKFLKSSPST